MKAKYVVPFLKAGRLVSVVEPNQSWGWGMVVNFQERKGQRVSRAGLALVAPAPARPLIPFPCHGSQNQPSYYIVDVLLRCATGSEVSATRAWWFFFLFCFPHRSPNPHLVSMCLNCTCAEQRRAVARRRR